MIDICIPTCKAEGDLEKQIQDIKDNTNTEYKLVLSCQPVSASKNRNLCLNECTHDLIIMMDDDMTGFFPGWESYLIDTMNKNKDCVMCSPRLMMPDGKPGYMLGDGNGRRANDRGIIDVVEKELPTACIIIRKNDLRFDEYYIGSGFEDNTYCIQLRLRYPNAKFMIDNRVKLVHINEMKNQKGKWWEYNKEYFDKNFKKYRLV